MVRISTLSFILLSCSASYPTAVASQAECAAAATAARARNRILALTLELERRLLRHPGMHVALLLLTGQFFFVEAQPGIEAGEEPAVGQALGVEARTGGAARRAHPPLLLVPPHQPA